MIGQQKVERAAENHWQEWKELFNLEYPPGLENEKTRQDRMLFIAAFKYGVYYMERYEDGRRLFNE